MPVIVVPSFAGEIPKTSPRLLEANIATKAINCNLERGQLEPLKGPAFIERLYSPACTIFKHEQDGWLSWSGNVNVVKSAVLDIDGEKPLGQLFITGDKAYPTQYLAGGATCRLGLPRPENAPEIKGAPAAVYGTVACYAWGTDDPEKNLPRYGYEDAASLIEPVNVELAPLADAEEIAEAGDITDSGIARSSSYCYTYIRSLADGIIKQESAPSPPTAVIDVADGDGVLLTGFSVPDLPELNVTHIRIYRTVSGNETSEFHFLCELAWPVSEYLDTIHDSDMPAEVLQTATWDEIPDDATGLILASNGIYAAFRGNELLLSEPFYAYAFPSDYRLTVEDKIVCLGLVDNTIIVLTEGRPYLVSGAEPGQMQLVRLPLEQSCVAANSRAYLAGGVIYVCPDGLMLFSASDQALATIQTFTREQWQELEPGQILGAILNDKYYGFFSGTNKGFIFSPGRQDVVFIELPETMLVTCVYHHSKDDCLYLAILENGKAGIYKWEAGEPLSFTWRSRPFFTSRLSSMRAVRIEGEQTLKNRIEVRIYGPDLKRARQKMKLEDTRSKRILPTRSEKLWSLELHGKATVYEARLAGAIEDLEY